MVSEEVKRVKEALKRARLFSPTKAGILNQIDYYLSNALVDSYLIQDSIKQLRKLISQLANGEVKMNVIDFEIKKGKTGKEIVLYCPFDIEVHINRFMFKSMVEEWGDLDE
jgi:hypothetical protein